MTDSHAESLWSRHRHWLAPLLIFVAALVVRLVYIQQFASSPTFAQPIMDERYHLDFAELIDSPKGLPDEPYFRAPLYPYFLALLLRATSDSLYTVRLIQSILGSLLPVLVYLLGLRLFDRRIAYWAGGIAALYPTFIYYDSALLITSLMVLLTSLLALVLLRCESEPRRVLSFVAAGLLLGLAGLARPNILLLGPALFIWLWVLLRPQLGAGPALRRYLLIAVTSLVVILPVTVRNYLVGDDLVFIAWQGGYNFYIGNNHEANGWSATAPGIAATWEGGYRESIAVAEESEGRPLKRSEVSDFWYGLAWKEIRNHPSTFISLLFRKLRLFVNGYEIPNNLDIYLSRDVSSIMKPLLFARLVYFPFGLLAPLAIIGLVMSLTEWRRYLLVYVILGSYLATLLMFFVCARYRQPLIPFMILFAVYGVVRIIDFRRRRQGKNLALALFMLALLIAESNHNTLGLNPRRTAAEDHNVIGNAYLRQNNLAGAEFEYKQAVAADSTFAPAYNNLGLISTRRNRIRDAVRYYNDAVRVDPDYVEGYVNLATTYLEANDPKSAATILERAALRHPRNDMVQLKLGAAYSQLDRTEDAVRAFQRCLQLNPNNSLARSALESLQKKRTDSPAP